MDILDLINAFDGFSVIFNNVEGRWIDFIFYLPTSLSF